MTAVEFLVNTLNHFDRNFSLAFKKEIEQAKEMEKQQRYNKEDLKQSFNGFKTGMSFDEWFEQFKNK